MSKMISRIIFITLLITYLCACNTNDIQQPFANSIILNLNQEGSVLISRGISKGKVFVMSGSKDIVTTEINYYQNDPNNAYIRIIPKNVGNTILTFKDNGNNKTQIQVFVFQPFVVLQVEGNIKSDISITNQLMKDTIQKFMVKNSTFTRDDIYDLNIDNEGTFSIYKTYNEVLFYKYHTKGTYKLSRDSILTLNYNNKSYSNALRNLHFDTYFWGSTVSIQYIYNYLYKTDSSNSNNQFSGFKVIKSKTNENVAPLANPEIYVIEDFTSELQRKYPTSGVTNAKLLNVLEVKFSKVEVFW